MTRVVGASTSTPPWSILLLQNRSIDFTKIQLITALNQLKDGNTFEFIFFTQSTISMECIGTIGINGKKRLYNGKLYYWLTNDSRRSFMKAGESILHKVL